MLKRLRLSHEVIWKAVLTIDDAVLSIDSLESIKHFVPTQDEVRRSRAILKGRNTLTGYSPRQANALRAYEGKISSLSAGDQYFSQVSPACGCDQG